MRADTVVSSSTLITIGTHELYCILARAIHDASKKTYLTLGFFSMHPTISINMINLKKKWFGLSTTNAPAPKQLYGPRTQGEDIAPCHSIKPGSTRTTSLHARCWRMFTTFSTHPHNYTTSFPSTPTFYPDSDTFRASFVTSFCRFTTSTYSHFVLHKQLYHTQCLLNRYNNRR